MAYLSVHLEYSELGLFVVHKIVSEYAESIETYLEKYLSAYGENAKTPSSPNAPRDIRLGDFLTKNKNILDLRFAT